MRTRTTTCPDSVMAMPAYRSEPTPSLSKAIHTFIAIMHAKNPTLLEHGQRTAHYATALGHAIGIPIRDLIDLYYAAMLHDIGQVMLPDDVVQKRGPLTHEEYTVLQCHPREGGQLLETTPALRRAAILVAHHHEHWDGSGYPYGLRNTFIPIGSRILAIADRFDALRSGQDGSHVDERLAVKLIGTLAGSQLDPVLVGVFVHFMEEHSRECFALHIG